MRTDFLDLDPKTLPARGTAKDWSQTGRANQDTIRRHCLAGRLPYCKLGDYLIIERDDFLAWLAAGYPLKGRPRKYPRKVPKAKEALAT
jgi:hypothetical protein